MRQPVRGQAGASSLRRHGVAVYREQERAQRQIKPSRTLAIILEGQLALLITECRVKLSVKMLLVEKRCRALFFVAIFVRIGRDFLFFGFPYSFSFFPLRLFLPPFPLFLGILTVRDQASGGKMCGERGGRLGFVVRWICWRSIRSWLM